MFFLITRLSAALAAIAVLAGLATDVRAQGGPPSGVSWQATGFAAYQGDSDLDDGGSFTVARGLAEVGFNYGLLGGGTVGFSVAGGASHYDFSSGTDFGGGDPWGRIDEWSFSLPVFLPIGGNATGLVIPTVRYAGESGASFRDGESYGAIVGVFWRISENLTLGPGAGILNEVDDETVFFPFLIIDWDITDRWNLSTGRGLAASRGPGLTLEYAATDTLRIGIATRFEESEFRLDDDGTAPGGIGFDRSIPVVATVAWEPNPGLSVSGFAGVALDGRVTLKDSDDRIIDRQDYDPAPVFGGTLVYRF
ncbi:MAG: hypothetical protein AAGH83_05270 [Pseudomonadota bacterium]